MSIIKSGGGGVLADVEVGVEFHCESGETEEGRCGVRCAVIVGAARQDCQDLTFIPTY